eukprot:875780_1
MSSRIGHIQNDGRRRQIHTPNICIHFFCVALGGMATFLYKNWIGICMIIACAVCLTLFALDHGNIYEWIATFMLNALSFYVGDICEIYCEWKSMDSVNIVTNVNGSTCVALLILILYLLFCVGSGVVFDRWVLWSCLSLLYMYNGLRYETDTNGRVLPLWNNQPKIKINVEEKRISITLPIGKGSNKARDSILSMSGDCDALTPRPMNDDAYYRQDDTLYDATE